MSKGLYGSICLEDLFEGVSGRAQDGSVWVNLSSLTQGVFNVSQKNGKHYAQIAVWIHDEPDQFQFNGSVQLSLSKEDRAAGKKGQYIGNLKFMQQQQAAAPYNPNPQYAQPQYQQAPQNWGQQPNQGPGGFVAPGQWPAQQNAPQPAQQNYPPAPAPGNFPAPPTPPNYGQQPQYGPQQGPPQGPPSNYQAPQQQAPQPAQNQQWPANPGNAQQSFPPQGPQPVTQQMITDANRAQPQGPPQFGQQPQGAWTPVDAGQGPGKLPF